MIWECFSIYSYFPPSTKAKMNGFSTIYIYNSTLKTYLRNNGSKMAIFLFSGITPIGILVSCWWSGFPLLISLIYVSFFIYLFLFTVLWNPFVKVLKNWNYFYSEAVKNVWRNLSNFHSFIHNLLLAVCLYKKWREVK